MNSFRQGTKTTDSHNIIQNDILRIIIMKDGILDNIKILLYLLVIGYKPRSETVLCPFMKNDLLYRNYLLRSSLLFYQILNFL